MTEASPERDALRAFLTRHAARFRGQEPPAPDPAALADVSARAATPFPDILWDLYSLCDGFYVGLDVYVVHLPDLDWFNTDEDWARAFPGAVYFAMDEGSGVFFIDAAGRLQRGAGAVFWCDRAAMTPNVAIYCGGSVLEFLDAVVREADPREGPDLSADAMARLNAAMAALPDAWSSQPGLSPIALTQFEIAHRVPLPSALKNLLVVADAFAVPRAALALYPLASMRRLGSSERAVAVEIGHMGARRLAISIINGEGFPTLDPAVAPIPYDDGFLILLDPGADASEPPPADAPVLGYLPDVLRAQLTP